ncbi:unnamed protein product [Prunus armeniaca]|uniref:Uncharacterized protein n=1 Tax=Prunus armeniaca TaxID=36596 RepID=A0A6J5UE92_PRUAR|nr:unnamed protein product [Prunus armeniaca]
MRKGLHIGLITNAFRYLPFGKALNLVSLEGCFSVLDLGDLLLYLQYSKAQERTFPLQPKTRKIQNMIRNKCPSPVVQQPQPFQPEPAGFDLNLPQGGAEPAVGIERDFFDLNLPAQPEPGEIEDIGSRFSKKELISMGLPANLQNLSLEQQQDLWLRAWEHFRLKVPNNRTL